VLTPPDNRSLLSAFLGDGRFPLVLTGAALVFSGAFAIFQSITGHFLPHDVAELGMDAQHLERAVNRNLVLFMFHDRVAFGGTLIAIGAAYGWLAEFPLRQGMAWAWRAFAFSGAAGFLSFLAYIGYGYLDTWHGVATLVLLPLFLTGLLRSRRLIVPAPVPVAAAGKERLARALLAFDAWSLLAAGCVILFVGMTRVFVPQDLSFIAVPETRLRDVSPVLVPLIAHDRAGFGGGLLCTGILLLQMTRCAALTRNFTQIVAVMGLAGFGAAIGVHHAVGYRDFLHLLPAYAGAAIFCAALILLVFAYREKCQWEIISETMPSPKTSNA